MKSTLLKTWVLLLTPLIYLLILGTFVLVWIAEAVLSTRKK